MYSTYHKIRIYCVQCSIDNIRGKNLVDSELSCLSIKKKNQIIPNTLYSLYRLLELYCFCTIMRTYTFYILQITFKIDFYEKWSCFAQNPM